MRSGDKRKFYCNGPHTEGVLYFYRGTCSQPPKRLFMQAVSGI
jgi:hypothetical protein